MLVDTDVLIWHLRGHVGATRTLGDALVAATAIDHGLPILTVNTRHFEVISELRIERFEP